MVFASAQRTALIGRARLVERIDRALLGRGVVLIAGPGYGKTTLLTSCLVRLGTPWVWCDLVELHGDPLAFVRRLLAEAERLAPRLGRRERNRLRRSSATSQGAMVALDSLLTAHGAVPAEPILVVVDELQVAHAGSELERYLDHLLRRLPSHWRILLASREEPSSRELARLIQYGEVTALTEDDLAFTLEETAALLALDRPPAVAWAQAAQVHARAGGWPAGVTLVGSSLLTEVPAGAAPAVVGPTTYRYFARVVLAEVEPALSDFLFRTSILPFLEPVLCDATLGASDSAQQLVQLADRHVFVVARQHQPGTYRYHALFQEFLLAELRTRLSPGEVRGLRKRAADYLLSVGLIEDAADQLIELADWDGLADLLRVHGEVMIHSGQTTTVIRWLDRVPSGEIAQSPWMLLYRGRCLRLRELPGDLRSLQRRAQALFVRQGEGNGRAVALLEEAVFAKHGRENAEAVALCLEALSVVGNDAQVRSAVTTTLVHYYTMLGRLTEAQAAAQEALGLLPQIQHAGTRAVRHILIKRRLGQAYAYGGDFHRALALVRESCEIAEAEDVDECTRVPTLYVRAFVEAMRGDFDDALANLDRAEQIADQYRLDLHGRRIRGTRAEIFATLDQIEAAEAEFRRADWLADEWADAGYFYYRVGQYEKAIALYEAEIARAGAAADPVNRARAQALLGACLVALGTTAAGKPLLEHALTTYQSFGFQSRVPGIGLHLADLAFAEGREADGRVLLQDALATARAGGACHFFALHPGVLRRNLARARALGLDPHFVGVLQRRWAKLLTPTAAAAQAGREQIWLPYRDLLEACPDEQIRADLARALIDGRVTAAGLQKLRSEYRFTWREVQVFVRYYLRRDDASADWSASSRVRLDLAAELGVAEYTLRYHINSIRSKLGLGGQRSLAVYRWASAAGIVE